MSTDARRPGLRIAIVSTAPPRRCGIATFAADLADAMAPSCGDGGRVDLVALDDVREGYPYGPRVRFQIQADRLADYARAAEFLEINRYDAVIVQFEYGIFGGRDGAHLLRLLRDLRMPVITTVHTALLEPSPGQREVLERVADLSARLVVISRRAGEIIRERYAVAPGRIVHIPHGIHDVPFTDPAFYKDRFDVERHRVILTFGLLSPNKGIETMLEAMPRIVARHPDVVYIVLGATHPAIRRQFGEAYRQALYRKIEELGIADHVRFHDRFVDLDTLLEYLGSADIYVTPYPNREQVSSGTLAYALGSGKAIVSTPYWYAEELLADDRGVLVPFRDPGALADAIIELLDDEPRRNEIRRRAYQYGREMIWPRVGARYVELVREAVDEQARRPRPRGAARTARADRLPEPEFEHLTRLSDDTGLLSHATLTVQDRSGGYRTALNAWAWAAACREMSRSGRLDQLDQATRWSAFVAHALDRRDGTLRTEMNYERRFVAAADPVELARTLWGLGVAVREAPTESMRTLATRLFVDLLPRAARLDDPTALGHAIVGLQEFLAHFGGNTEARRVRALLAGRLAARFDEHADEDWPWCAPEVGPASARIAQALVMAGSWIPDGAMCARGLDLLAWLWERQHEDFGFSPAGSRAAWRRGGTPARFDQLPAETAYMVEAARIAWETTGDESWRRRAWTAFEWFLGANILREPLVDFRSGGCRDALSPQGPNENQGAEASLAWLSALYHAHELAARSGLASSEKAPAGETAGTQRTADGGSGR
ncbi:MAG: glycosyltransferase family 4 protein [Acidobacteriota bacterium]